MEKIIWNKQNIENELTKRVLQLEFTKIDGSTRKMYATLSQNIIPRMVQQSSRLQKKKDDCLVVYDIEVSDWRMFIWNNLKKVEGETFSLEEIEVSPMTMKEYETSAMQLDSYTNMNSSFGLVYVALKLTGKAGEFSDNLGKAIRSEDFKMNAKSGKSKSIPFITKRELLLKELGDILWHVSAAAKELDSSLEEVAKINIQKLVGSPARGTLNGSGDNR